MLPIYVDIDDVLADTSSCLIEIAEKEFCKRVAFEELTSFDLMTSFCLSRKEYEHFLAMAHQPDEILNLAPIPEAIQTLEKWASSGHEIFVVTGRPTSTHDTTLEWLARHEVPYDRFFMVNKYARPGMDEAIALSMPAFSKMKFQFAIEDAYDMAVHLAETMDTRVLLYDRPWNRGPDRNGNIRRFRWWDELQDIP
jgi:uncharacterized HAD superfamily protein